MVVLFGFNSLADPLNTTNTAFALLMLACCYSVIPALFKFVALPLLWHYPLTEVDSKKFRPRSLPDTRRRNRVSIPDDPAT